MSNFIGTIKRAVSFRSSRSHSSSRARFDMEVDPPFLAIGSSSRTAQEESFTLLRDKDIKLQDNREKGIFWALKERTFAHTPVLDSALLQSTGMDSEFDLTFKNIGWENAWELHEQGCRFLTIEFLCTLQPKDTEVYFRLFNKEFSPSWKKFSRFLCFPKLYAVDINDFGRIGFGRI